MSHELSDVLQRAGALNDALAEVGEVLAYAARVAATKELRMTAEGACSFLQERLAPLARREGPTGTAVRQVLLYADNHSGTCGALEVVLGAVEAAGA